MAGSEPQDGWALPGPASPRDPSLRDPSPGTPPPGTPSLEETLASIRHILSEEEAAAKRGVAKAGTLEPADEADVLRLDESMLVNEPGPGPAFQATPPAAAHPALPPARHAALEPMPMATDPEHHPIPLPAEAPRTSLVAPEAAAAASASMGTLLRTLHVDRPPPVQVTRAGLTLEDIVRDELRPILKTWLDANLPPLVERLVRAEIERVVGRARED